MNDTEYMRLALELAKKGCGWTSPNPMVGAVIVKDGQIIGQGWHERYGQPHAERNALASCAVDPEGATMYVTLEPCCHFGKQPPCVNAILEAGISRVVVGSADPNPLVSGKGIAALRVQGGSGDGRHFAGRMRRTQSDILPFYNDKTPVCFYEVCHDNGRKNCHSYGRIQMDYKGSCPSGCSTTAASFQRNHGRCRNHSCR